MTLDGHDMEYRCELDGNLIYAPRDLDLYTARHKDEKWRKVRASKHIISGRPVAKRTAATLVLTRSVRQSRGISVTTARGLLGKFMNVVVVEKLHIVVENVKSIIGNTGIEKNVRNTEMS